MAHGPGSSNEVLHQRARGIVACPVMSCFIRGDRITINLVCVDIVVCTCEHKSRGEVEPLMKIISHDDASSIEREVQNTTPEHARQVRR